MWSWIQSETTLVVLYAKWKPHRECFVADLFVPTMYIMSSSQGRRKPVGCECVATYSGRSAAARLFIWQHSIALQSCSADAVFILGMQYLYPGVLRCAFGVRYVVSVLVNNLSRLLFWPNPGPRSVPSFPWFGHSWFFPESDSSIPDSKRDILSHRCHTALLGWSQLSSIETLPSCHSGSFFMGVGMAGRRATVGPGVEASSKGSL